MNFITASCLMFWVTSLHTAEQVVPFMQFCFVILSGALDYSTCMVFKTVECGG